MGLVALFAGPARADKIMIAPSEFAVGQPGTGDIIHFYCGYTLYPYTDATYDHFFAPVDLPQDARVTSVVVFYEDDDPTYFRVMLVRSNMCADASQVMCQWASSSDTSGWQSHKISPISYGKINNGGYTYFLYVRFYDSPGVNSDIQIKGIRINCTM